MESRNGTRGPVTDFAGNILVEIIRLYAQRSRLLTAQIKASDTRNMVQRELTRAQLKALRLMSERTFSPAGGSSGVMAALERQGYVTRIPVYVGRELRRHRWRLTRIGEHILKNHSHIDLESSESEEDPRQLKLFDE